jgi:DNA-binding LacI/PurR family transcriptional regulator
MRGRKLPPERELSKQFGMSRGRVRAILDELEAKGLVSRHQGSGTYALEDGSSAIANVALLVDSQLKLGSDHVFSTLIERVQQICQTEGCRCTLQRVGPGEIPTIVEDGVIAVGSGTVALLERFGRKDPPAVGLLVRARATPGARLSILDVDEYAGGRAAIANLVADGCTTLIFIECSDAPPPGERMRGAKALAEERQVPLRLTEAGGRFSDGMTEAAQLPLPADGSIVGVVCCNAQFALGLHVGLMSRSAETRQRVRILSFDASPITADRSIGVRTLAAPTETMASDAVAELRRLAAAPLPSSREILYPLLDQTELRDK